VPKVFVIVLCNGRLLREEYVEKNLTCQIIGKCGCSQKVTCKFYHLPVPLDEHDGDDLAIRILGSLRILFACRYP
jgi:hypothetical protein